MRNLDQPEHTPVLGKAIPREKQPEPLLQQVEGARDGVMVGSDGKMQTAIPENEFANIVNPWFGLPVRDAR